MQEFKQNKIRQFSGRFQGNVPIHIRRNNEFYENFRIFLSILTPGTQTRYKEICGYDTGHIYDRDENC